MNARGFAGVFPWPRFATGSRPARQCAAEGVHTGTAQPAERQLVRRAARSYRGRSPEP